MESEWWGVGGGAGLRPAKPSFGTCQRPHHHGRPAVPTVPPPLTPHPPSPLSHPLGRDHHRLRAQGVEEVVEVIEVAHLDVEVGGAEAATDAEGAGA